MSNSDTFDYQLSQFGSWYLMAGIESYLDDAYEVCQCETLLLELDRLEAWESENGGFYSYEHVPAAFADLRERITERLQWIESEDEAYRRRARFTVISGGKC